MQDKEVIRERIRFTRAMIETTGWQLMLRDWESDIHQLEQDCALHAKTFDAIQFNRGAMSALRRLVNLEKIVDAAEQALDAPEAEAEE